MKYVLEFGVRGGAHTENVVLPTFKLAQQLAAALVMTYVNDNRHEYAKHTAWEMGANCPRRSWQSPTHFVSISKLDGIARGPASTSLWRKQSAVAA